MGERKGCISPVRSIHFSLPSSVVEKKQWPDRIHFWGRCVKRGLMDRTSIPERPDVTGLWVLLAGFSDEHTVAWGCA